MNFLIKSTVEFIGTFLLVFTVGMTAGNETLGNYTPLIVVSILTVMIYGGSHISGAHYNPAVTFGILMRGKVTTSDLAAYIIAQVLAAVTAALTVSVFRQAPVLITGTDFAGIFAAEFIFTFALMYVILFTAVLKESSGNQIYGVAIGLTVFAGAVSVGDVSGDAFNPAVYIGAAILELLPGSSAISYLGAQISGAAAAVLLFNYRNPVSPKNY